MLLLDKDRILVGIKLNHLLVLVVLSMLIFASMALYREHAYGFSNIVRVEGGWKAQWSGAWHPWGEIETFEAFRDDSETHWRWLPTGNRLLDGDNSNLNTMICPDKGKVLAEKFKGK